MDDINREIFTLNKKDAKAVNVALLQTFTDWHEHGIPMHVEGITTRDLLELHEKIASFLKEG